uniref:Bacterial spot disease resistance protein 4 n=1 Tax=Solanum tuberosum TaxID=4113 RepID=M1BF57_SOLTU
MGMPNLEYLDLEECMSLEEVHHSLRCSRKLIELNLNECGSLNRFPYVNVESLEYLNLSSCYSLEKSPEFLGIMKPELMIMMSFFGIMELPSSIIEHQAGPTSLDLSEMNNLVALPSSICRMKGLVKLIVWGAQNLKACQKKKVNEGLPSLVALNLSDCNLIDGGLPEDIGSLSSLETLHLNGNNFERLPRSIAQLGALRSLDLSDCKRLTQLPEDIGCLSYLKKLNLSGNNFEYLPRSIAQLGALEYLHLSDCKRLTQLPEFPHTINADWSNSSICNSLFQNISLLHPDTSDSHSLSLRVFTSRPKNIPSWFHLRGTGTSVLVNLPMNWYVTDNFLGFAVCYSGELNDNTAHLIPLCDAGMSLMTQKLALSNHAEYLDDINFLLVPLGGLWDASKANGKTPND